MILAAALQVFDFDTSLRVRNRAPRPKDRGYSCLSAVRKRLRGEKFDLREEEPETILKSCDEHGHPKLILNRALIRSSVDAIDYVITHELCHMRHKHHGPEFFRLLEREMPDWEKAQDHARTATGIDYLVVGKCAPQTGQLRKSA